MIRRVSDSVEIGYSFHGIGEGGKPAIPAHYCLSIKTGRETLALPEVPVPEIEHVTGLVEAYRHEWTETIREGNIDRDNALDRCMELRHSIERELLNYAPIPEFMTYRYKDRYYAVLNVSVRRAPSSKGQGSWVMLREWTDQLRATSRKQ